MPNITPSKTMLSVTPSAPPTRPGVLAAGAGSGVKRSAIEPKCSASTTPKRTTSMSAMVTSARPESIAPSQPIELACFTLGERFCSFASGIGCASGHGNGDPNLWERDSRSRLRLRRPDPRHRGARLPVVARGLPGPRRGAAVRALGADRRLDHDRLPSPAPPRRAAGPAAAAGGAGSPQRAPPPGEPGPRAGARRRLGTGCGPRAGVEARRGVELDGRLGEGPPGDRKSVV